MSLGLIRRHMHRLYTICLGRILSCSLTEPESGYDSRPDTREAGTIEQCCEEHGDSATCQAIMGQ